MFKDSTITRPMNMSQQDFDEAAERGRSMAEAYLAKDPVQRLMVESQFGIEYCKARYPLAYVGVA